MYMPEKPAPITTASRSGDPDRRSFETSNTRHPPHSTEPQPRPHVLDPLAWESLKGELGSFNSVSARRLYDPMRRGQGRSPGA